MKVKLEAAFAGNHACLFRLYYGEGGITPSQHQRLHAMNWLLLEKKLLDLGLEARPTDDRSQEVAALLTGLNIADVGWKVITLKDGRRVAGLKTVAEILKEAGL